MSAGFAATTALSPALAKIALADFNETDESRQTALVELRRKISELPPADRIADTSDENLVRFLRAKKYDMSAAVETSVKLSRFNTKYGEALADISEEEMLLYKDFIHVVREPGPEGRVIFIMRPKLGISVFTPEYVAFNPRAMLRSNVWMFDRISRDPQAQVNGIVLIVDYNGFTLWDNFAMSKMASMGDQLATFNYFQLLGMRFKGAYIFQEPPFLDWIWFFVKPFMSEKIRSRFHPSGSNYEVLKNVIPDQACIPQYLGGGLADDNIDPWIAQQFSK